MRFIRGLLYLIIFVAIIVGGVFVGARFNDGPIAIFPGGPLEAGELIADPVEDWSFVTDIQEIEMQLAYQNTSRTTWIVVHEGKAYIPVSLGFPPGKTWHYAADENGEAILRIDGKKYPVALSRVMDEELAVQIDEPLRAKYPRLPGNGGGEDEPSRWYFNVSSR